MTLNEFKRTMQFPEGFPRKLNEIDDFMESNGWHLIGNDSCYSVVYGSKDENVPYVMKVNVKEDRAFAHFAMLTHKFPNKHFPVIGNAKIFKTPKGTKIYAYLIEKLEEIQSPHEKLSNTSYTQQFVKAYQMLGGDMKKTMDYLKYDLRPNGWFDDRKAALRELKTYMRDNKSLVKAMQILALNSKAEFDMHQQNYMQRKDGTVVIIDPLVNYPSVTKDMRKRIIARRKERNATV